MKSTTSPLTDAITALVEERTLIAGRLAEIDHALETVRQALSGALTTPLLRNAQTIEPTTPDAPVLRSHDVPKSTPLEERPHAPAPTERPAAVAAPAGSGAAIELVQARDAAILAHLKRGPATRADLVEVLPKEPWKTPDQRSSDCGNSIMRLKAKKLITQTDTGWALA